MKSKIEEILLKRKDSIKPSETLLFSILNQIPEKKLQSEKILQRQGDVGAQIPVWASRSTSRLSKKTIKSPYFWITFTQVVSLCFLLITVYPEYKTESLDLNLNKELYSEDEDIELFEIGLDSLEYEDLLVQSI